MIKWSLFVIIFIVCKFLNVEGRCNDKNLTFVEAYNKVMMDLMEKKMIKGYYSPPFSFYACTGDPVPILIDATERAIIDYSEISGVNYVIIETYPPSYGFNGLLSTEDARIRKDL